MMETIHEDAPVLEEAENVRFQIRSALSSFISQIVGLSLKSS